MLDLSATGLRIRTLAILPKHTEVEATLVLPDGQHLRLNGKVKWFSAPDHARGVQAELGLQLRDVPDAYLQALARILSEQG